MLATVIDDVVDEAPAAFEGTNEISWIVTPLILIVVTTVT